MKKTHRKILIVDDDINITQLLILLLRQNGHEIVATTDSGETAVVAAAEHTPDLVIMDIMLKGTINGIDAASKIHHSLQIPIIFITAVQDQKLFKRAKVTEPYGYIIKPFNERDLIIAVEIALQRKMLNDKVKNTEQFAQNIINSSMDMIITVDNRRKITEFNHVAEVTFGYKKSELIGRHINILYANPRKGLAVHKRTIERGRHVQEIENKRKNGEVFPAALAASVLYDSRGVKIGVMGISRDMSAQNKVEKMLMESEIRYRETLDSMLEGCQIIGYDWTYLYVNDTVAKQGRKAKKDLLGKTMMEAYPGIERTAMFAHLKRCMANGISHIMENEFEYPDGEKRWFQLNIQPAREGLFILSLDITERKLEEIKFAFYNQRMNAVRRASRILTQSLELQETLNSCIEVGRTTFEADDVTLFLIEGKYLIPKATTSEYFKEIMAMRLKPGEGLSGKVFVSGKAQIINRVDLTDVGAQIPNTPREPESLMCAPLIIKNNPIGVLTLSKIGMKEFQESDLEFIQYLADISAIAIQNARLYESSRKSEKLKSLIIENISHEIRTPLTGIMGFSQLLKEQFQSQNMIDEDNKIFFEAIESSGKRLIKTVHEMLDISQLESGIYKPQPESFDLNEVVNSIVNELRLSAEKKSLRVEISHEIQKLIIKADKYTITQAISNLVDNSIKYTEKGGLFISTSRLNSQYELKITDTGIAIDEDYLGNMYDAFTQESEGYTKTYQGIGLGLTIVKKALDLNNVTLDVKSQKGVGTTFTLTFHPVEGKTEPVKVEPAVTRTPLPPKTVKHKQSILIVEDDPSTQNLIKYFLKNRYEIHFAESVSEAKEAIQKNSIDLVLLDLSLKGNEDGLDFVKYLRKSKQWKQLPVIATTAHAFISDKDRCLDIGCNDYLTKPIKMDLLLEKIRLYLKF